jgi:hypothetical protein
MHAEDFWKSSWLAGSMRSSRAAASGADSRWPQIDALLHFLPVCTIAQNRWDLRPSSPNLIRTRSNNRHTPLARPAAQNVLNDRLHFGPDRGISGVMQLDQHSHFLSIQQRHFCGRGATCLSCRCCSSRLQLLTEHCVVRIRLAGTISATLKFTSD